MTQPISSDALNISAVAIMRNETQDLPGLIENLRGWCRELILVDDCSTDGSAELAKLVGGEFVRVLPARMDPELGFAGLRNLGLAEARGDWVLHMDCDERATPQLVTEIMAAIQSTKMLGFRYRRLNYFLHRPMQYGDWRNWNRPQFARRQHHHFEGRLHETCVIDGSDAAIGQFNSKMLHLNDKDFSERLRKSEQYVAMEADRIAASGRKVTAGDILYRPLREFAKAYLARQGFRDGTPGLISALHSATAVFRAYALVWDRQNRISRAELERQVSWAAADRNG